jgi:hypothetical protein
MGTAEYQPTSGSGEERDSPKSGSPAAAEGPRSTEHLPAQGHIQTGARYRDRPSDDGKYGDEAEESIQKE